MQQIMKPPNKSPIDNIAYALLSLINTSSISSITLSWWRLTA